MFPVIRPRLAVARGERLAERHRLHEADLVHRQRFALEKTGVAAHHRLELPLRDLVGYHPETPREGDELAGAGHPRELARLERLHRDRGVEHHRLGHRRGRGGLAGIAPRPKHDTQTQQAVTAQGIHKSPARREYPV